MRYHYDKPSVYSSIYGVTHKCDHPVYDRCTLYLIEENGLAVIQQRYNPKIKATYWTEIDTWLTDALYLNERFMEFFKERSGTGRDGIFPTVSIRQIMWALKMKPIPKEKWETCFDRRSI